MCDGEKTLEVLKSAADARKDRVVHLLPYEVSLMHRQVESLAELQIDVIKALGEAMEQSSETWHDNAPGEVVKDEAGTLYWQFKQLRILAGDHEVVEYPLEHSLSVAIGSRAVIQLDSAEPFTVDVVGASLLGREAYDDELNHVTATYDTPLAQAILGANKGDTFDAEIQSGRPQTVTIVDVDQRAQRTQYDV